MSDKPRIDTGIQDDPAVANAIQVLSSVPTTKLQWIRLYGIPGLLLKRRLGEKEFTSAHSEAKDPTQSPEVLVLSGTDL